MGSGLLLKSSIRAHDKENHKFEILEFCSDRKSLFEREAELVSVELMEDPLCMNLCKGGEGGTTFTGMVSVRDKDGKRFWVKCSDPRYISGELVSTNKGMIPVKDKTGKTFQVDRNDPRWISGELISTSIGKVVVEDETGERFLVDGADPRYISGELIGATKGKAMLKDKTGKTVMVDCNDPRYISGELVGPFTGRSHSEESKRKISNSAKGSGLGNKNSQYGTCWVFKDIAKKIKKEELDSYLSEGWIRGRK